MPPSCERRQHSFWLFWILVAHAGLLVYSAHVHSPNSAEVAHVGAGVSHWRFGDFSLFRVNPPLPRLIATLPVVATSPRTDWHRASTDAATRSEFVVGEDFITANGPHARSLLNLARWASIPWSLVGALVCTFWASELYGRGGGYLALVLWCCGPTILGHGPTVGPDVAAAGMGVAAAYAFWKWLKKPHWATACVAGLMLGLVQLTKLTWVVLFPLWPAIWLVWKARRAEREKAQAAAHDGTGSAGRSWAVTALQMASILLLAVYVINVGYGFEGTFQRLGDCEFVSETLAGPSNPKQIGAPGRNRFAGTWLGAIRVPLPQNYVMGIDRQKWDFERGLPSYARGEWADHGWWYYYLYALAIKVPLGTWCLLALAIGVTLFPRGYSAPWRDEMVVLAPGLAILIFVSSQTGFSVHSRYVIPALPFFFVWASKAARVFDERPFTRKRRAIAAAVVLALAWSVTSSLWAYPHSLSYFNELAGGPKHGGEHLLDSNIDWGQDLFYLKRWLDQHPEVKLDGLAYLGSYPVTLAGIPETPHPPQGSEMARGDPKAGGSDLGPQPGWYALSVNYLYGRSRQYRYFLQFEPVGSAGYSIYIYHVTPEEANRVRRESGLSEIPQTK